VDIKDEVRQFVVANFYVDDPIGITDQTSFLDSGIIDSTSVLELTGFLEDTFDIEIDDDELMPENLDTLAGIEAFVSRKLSS
jgi:acyl carrier protein